jgi:hypothetical protein
MDDQLGNRHRCMQDEGCSIRKLVCWEFWMQGLGRNIPVCELA